MVDTEEDVIPIEAKSEVNLKAKSLRTYMEKFEPTLSVRTSMADYKREESLVDLPLYAVESMGEF